MRNLLTLCAVVLCALANTQTLHAQASSGQKPELLFHRYNSNAQGHSTVLTGDTLGTISFVGFTVPMKPNLASASIRSVVTGAVTPGVAPAANLFFRTGSPTQHDRMVITAEGLVGIGTMLPEYHLHVIGNTHTTGDFYGRIHMDNNQSTNDAPNTYFDEVYFERKQRTVLGVPGAGVHGGLMTLAPGATGNDNQLFFGESGIYHRQYTNNASDWGAAPWDKLLTSADINGTPNRIAKFTDVSKLGDSQLWDNGTNVGIGTTTPGFKLDVNGTFRAGADARFEGDVITVGNTNTGTLNVAGAANVGGLTNTATLQVTGTALLQGNTLANNVTVNSNLHVDGVSEFHNIVAIGSSINAAALPPGHSLYVEGSIVTEEVKVALRADWPDYVFEAGYQLPDLCETESYIQTNKHLPGIPSAVEIKQNGGIELGEMNRILVEKVEELTLLLIDQQKQIDALKASMSPSKN